MELLKARKNLLDQVDMFDPQIFLFDQNITPVAGTRKEFGKDDVREFDANSHRWKDADAKPEAPAVDLGNDEDLPDPFGFSKHPYYPIQTALQYLAHRCDHAFKQDGQGFNGGDAPRGHDMAYLDVERWSPKMALGAYQMLKKYTGQLAGGGIDYNMIPKPTFEELRPDRINAVADRKVDFKDGLFVISFPYNAELVANVKATISNRRYEGGIKSWTTPATGKDLPDLLTLIDTLKFQVTPKAEAKIESLRDDAELAKVMQEAEIQNRTTNIEDSKKAEGTIVIEGLNGTLRPFQQAGVEYALKNKRVFIADEMGLGKTIQAIATIHASKAYPALVVCPASLKLNWKKEIEKWLPDYIHVTSLQGKNATSEFYGDIVIINYDNLKKNAEELKKRGFKSVVFDEFHYLKSSKAQRSKSALDIVKGAEYILGLTGTPIVNRPSELISQLTILDRLKDFGGFWSFASRYTGAFRTRFGLDMTGAQHLEELNEKLRSICYIRRNKKDVLKELPEKQRSVQSVELSNKAEYNKAEKELIEYLKNESVQDAEFLESIQHLPIDEQLVAKHNRMDSTEEKVRRAEHLVRFEALKQLCAKGKLEAFEEWIDNFLETGEKLVVFGTHKKIIRELANKYKCASITGSTPLPERHKAVEAFQNDENVKMIVLNIQAGGVGLTLTESSNVAFIEQAWTPSAHDQAEDRIHRIGQKNQANAWYFLAEDTIDDYIYDLIQRKRLVVDAGTDGVAKSGKGGSIMGGLIKKLIGKEDGEEDTYDPEIGE